MGLPRDCRRVRRNGNRVPAGAPSAVSPYIDKKSRSRAGAGCGGSFRIPKVPGFRSLRVEATSCWRCSPICGSSSGHGGTSGGHCQANAPARLASISRVPQRLGWCP